MNKFLKKIENNLDIAKERKEIHAKMAKAIALRKVEEAKERVLQLELQAQNINDIGPVNSTDLKFDFNAENWATKNIQNLTELRDAKIDLEIAQSFYNEWFGEDQ